MGIQLNIKNAETHALAAEVARRTGKTMAEAVNDSLKMHLRVLTKEERRARVIEIMNELKPLWKEPWKSMEHGDLLYDDLGLPK